MYAVTSSNSGSSSDSSAAIIGGVTGGVILLLMIIIVLCTVILCNMRRSHRKKAYSLDYKLSYDTNVKLNTNVIIDHNPSYDINQEYNYVQPDEPFIHSDEFVKMESNPSYGVTIGEDRETIFSTYSGTKAGQSLCNSQHDYDYVQNDQFLHHNTTTDTKQDNTIDTPYLAIVN